MNVSFKSKIGIIGALEADGIEVPSEKKPLLETDKLALPLGDNAKIEKLINELVKELVDETIRTAQEEMGKKMLSMVQ